MNFSDDDGDNDECGCEHCNHPSCATCRVDRGSTNCLHCDRRDEYKPKDFCEFCGRKLNDCEKTNYKKSIGKE